MQNRKKKRIESQHRLFKRKVERISIKFQSYQHLNNSENVILDKMQMPSKMCSFSYLNRDNNITNQNLWNLNIYKSLKNIQQNITPAVIKHDQNAVINIKQSIIDQRIINNRKFKYMKKQKDK